MEQAKLEKYPVQTPGPRFGNQSHVNPAVAMAAYEVYSKVYGPQEALVTGGCRGGLSTGEYIAFLYARSFPRAEWSARVDEAFKGMEKL